MSRPFLLVLFVSIFSCLSGAIAQDLQTRRYDIGEPFMRQVYVDPSTGSDSADGTAGRPLRSLREAWNRIPMAVELDTGIHIVLKRGDYTRCDQLPTYFESRWGTASAPVMISGEPGSSGSSLTVLGCGINMFDCRYVYLDGLMMVVPMATADVVHVDHCRNVLLRGVTMSGDQTTSQEVLKVNQSSCIYVEDCRITGAWDNGIDMVAVHDGHILGTTIANTGDWGCYVKGGSARMLIAGNRVVNCGTGGITAGQGTGFQFMELPYVHYEAYDVKIVNNLVQFCEGAAFGVHGGYNVLVAYNTAMFIGTRSHVLEAAFGERSCDGHAGDEGRGLCDTFRMEGGWGNAVDADGDNYVRIPNKNVYFYNNIIYNRNDGPSQWQQLFVPGPYDGPYNDGANLTAPAHADDNLRFVNNVIWNGPLDHPLGVGDDNGCGPDNPVCNETLLRTQNAINTLEPDIEETPDESWRPVAGSPLEQYATVPIPVFTDEARPATPVVPVGNLVNDVIYDYNFISRSSRNSVGAFVPGSTAGVREQATLPLLASPNPVAGTCTLRAPYSLGLVRMVDTRGEVVYAVDAGSLQDIVIDVSMYPPGVYAVHAGRSTAYIVHIR